MYKDKKDTTLFKMPKEGDVKILDVMKRVYEALESKGYEPKNQLIGYVLSGDPSYITSHNDARKLMKQVDRNELLEELLEFYLKNNNIG